MVLNFTASRYILLFLYSEIYIVHIINCEWSGYVNFPLHMFCMRYKSCFSNNWYQSGLHFRICITYFVSFGIRDSDFMMLEDSTINFLHGCWNYYFIKTDIDVMMLFKFDIKYVKLNLMAIASKEFPSINRMFLFNRSNGNQESIKSTWDFVINLFNFWPIENSFRSIEFSFTIDRIGIENWSSHLECLLKFSS